MKEGNLREHEEARYIGAEYHLRGLPNGLIVVFIGTFYQHVSFSKILFMLNEMQAIKLTEIKL